jgi:hypothetical protein
VPSDHLVGELDLPPADRDRGSGSSLPGGPPGERADTGKEFVYTERFGDVVVGACVGGGDLVAAARPAGEHDDGHSCPTAQTMNDVQTIDVGQAEVEHDEFRLLGGRNA